MNHADLSVRVGAFLSVLVFIHFVVDWVFQTHNEAMAKHNNWRVRARHCAVYTTPFVPFLLWVGVSIPLVFVSVGILFFSHFIEDTYLPVFYWAKWVRRPPSMRWTVRTDSDNKEPFVTDENGKSPIYSSMEPTWRTVLACAVLHGTISPKEAQKQYDKRGFLEFIDGTLGKILMIAIDQIIHIAFLLPVAWMAAKVP